MEAQKTVFKHEPLPAGSIKQVLMNRDGMSSVEANRRIRDCKADLKRRLAKGDMPHDICEEWFGLEPDYIFELID